MINNDKTHVMIDLETLSCHTNAAIISIAAVQFNMDGEILKSFQTRVKPTEWGKHNRHVDGVTVEWWLKQSDEARKAITDVTSNVSFLPLDEALIELTAFLNSLDKREDIVVWGNGSTMDITILQSAYEHFDLNLPWLYYNVNDVRTIVDLNPLYKKLSSKKVFKGVKHDAYADCLNQIKYLTDTIKSITVHNVLTANDLILLYKDKIKYQENIVVFLDDNEHLLFALAMSSKNLPVIYESIYNCKEFDEEGIDYYGEIKHEFAVAKVVSMDDFYDIRLKTIKEGVWKQLNSLQNNNAKEIYNQVMQDGGKFVRFSEKEYGLLVGASATDEDYYWVFLNFDTNGNRKMNYSSCVGGYTIIENMDKTEHEKFKDVYHLDLDATEAFIEENLNNTKHDYLFAKKII